MNIAEHIKALHATREKKAEEMKAVAQKAIDESRNMDAGEAEKIDTLRAEVKSIAADIKRFSELQEMDAQTAKAVDDTAEREKAYTPPKAPVSVKNTERLDKGVAFARAAKCLALGAISQRDPVQVAKSLYDGQNGIISAVNMMAAKDYVAPATTTDSEWAGALVQQGAGVIADFVEFLRPQTILGKFGVGDIPALRHIPFRVPMPGVTAGSSAFWTGEGVAKNVTSMKFGTSTLEPMKVATIAVATMELLRSSSPSADTVIRDDIAAAISERIDRDFIDPAKAAVAGVSPASVLNGVTGIASSGTNADAVRADVAAVFGAFTAANNNPSSGVWIMPTAVALQLSLMYTLAQREFPDIGISGGRFVGLPVIVSDYVPAGIVALVNAGDIYLADDGGVEISISREASLRMSDSAETDTTAPVVSLWQNNLVGFRAERILNWARRRESGVAYLTGVNWKV